VSNNLLDDPLLFQVGESLPCERAVDLQTVDKGSDSDEAVGLDILLELVRGLLVEDDGVIGLVLDYTMCKRKSFLTVRVKCCSKIGVE
jgi:hypothetical protein